MRTQPSAAETYRKLGIALGASLLLAALGPRPRALPFDQLLTRAAIAAAAGQPAAALASLDEAIRFDPALASLHLTAAQLAAQAGDAAGLREHLAAAPAEVQQTSSYKCLLARLPAEATVEAASPAPCTDDSSALEGSGPAIPPLADLDGMAAALQDQLENDPANLTGWEHLAALTELTDPAAVEAVILQAYRSFPEGSELLDGLWVVSHQDNPSLAIAERAARAGQLLAAQGDWALAGAAWARALEIEPEFPQARAYLGLATSMTGEDGLPLLLLASAEAPQDPIIRALLGQVSLSSGDAAGAVRQLELAHHLDPQNPAISATLGAALAQNGRLPEGAEAYRQAAVQDPQDPAFWRLLAEFSLRYDYQVDSIGLDAARNAVALSPENSASLSALGMAVALAGDGLTGERLLHQAISLDPSSALGWYRYALVLLEQGRADEARQALTTAARLDPDGTVGQLADASLANLLAGFR